MKKILFTTAYSKSSKNTWHYALKLAQYFDAQITLMHVYQDASMILTTGPDSQAGELSDNLDRFNEKKLFEEKNRLRTFVSENTPKQFHQLSFNYVAKTGNVAAAILEEEKNSDYGIIIIGTTTTSRLGSALFGSTARTLLAQSSSPVLLVPPMATYRGIRKIIYATNFESGDVSAIQQLIDWVEAFDAKLHLLHVLKNTYKAQAAKEKMKLLIDQFRKAKETGTVTTQFLEGRIAQSIQQYLQKIGGDMIALTTHNRGFFAQLFDPSITNQIASEAMVPILIFKEKIVT